MTQTDYKTDFVNDYIATLDDCQLMTFWNNYQDRHHYEHMIYNMHDFYDLVEWENDFFSLFNKMDKNFDNSQEFFFMDEYGEYCSADYVTDILDKFDMAELADYIIDYEDISSEIFSDDLLDIIIDYLQEAYELTEEQADKLRKYIEENICFDLSEDWDDYYTEFEEAQEEEED